MVEGLVEVGLGALDEGVDVVVIFIEGLEVGGLDMGGGLGEGFLGCDDGGFVAGHGVVGVEWEDEEVLDIVVFEFFDGGGDGGVAIGHGEFDGEVGILGNFFLEV